MPTTLLVLSTLASLLVAGIPAAAAARPSPADPPRLRVVTWNVQLGAGLGRGKPNVRHHAVLREHPDTGRPDVLALQEVCSGDGGWQLDFFDGLLRQAHGASFRAFAPSDPADPLPCARGEAIFSRFPITASGVMQLPVVRQARSAVWADLAVPAGDGAAPTRVRVYNAHLENRALRGSSEEGRLRQVHAILNHLRAFRAAAPDVPVILLGDLNSVGGVWDFWREEAAIVELRRRFRASPDKAGRTYGLLPFRLDWIFSDHLEVLHARVVQEWVSDHFPVVADFVLPPSPSRDAGDALTAATPPTGR